MHSSGSRPLCLPSKAKKPTNILLIVIMLAGDIETNRGPNRNASTYPCGLCENSVTWNSRGVCCDDCSIWHHKSCIELCTYDYELLERSNVQWFCCKCESINVSTFTFRSYELETSNIYEHLSNFNDSLDSIRSVFSPIKTSSPNTNQHTRNFSVKSSECSRSTRSSNPYDIPPKKNIRIITVNCRSIKDKNTEFERALHYLKPNIGTENMWN
jgi:hypothetical protein